MHYLKQYQTFKSVAELDYHVSLHKENRHLTFSEFCILRSIAGYASVHPGAAHLKIDTIATKSNVSTRTIYRTLAKLEQLGIIRRIRKTKRNGIKGANIYVILPHTTSAPTEKTARHEPHCSQVPNSLSNRVISEMTYRQSEPKAASPMLHTTNSRAELSFSTTRTNLKHNKLYNRALLDFFTDMRMPHSFKLALVDVIAYIYIESTQQLARIRRLLFKAITIATDQLVQSEHIYPFLKKALQEHDILEIDAPAFDVEAESRSIIYAEKSEAPRKPRDEIFYDWLTIREISL